MTENTPRPCEKCGSETRKQDICSRCRQKEQHEPKGFSIPRSETNRRADEILATPIEQAQSDYEFYKKLWMETNDGEALYRWKQARAILERENIIESTLT
jgi:hypothetical protein